MEKRSLKDVIEIVGLKKHLIQKYEAKGLAEKPAKPPGYNQKTSSCKLMYEPYHINILYRLRFYKELGFDVSDIDMNFKDKSSEEKNRILRKQVSELEEKIEDLKQLAAAGRVLCESGIEISDLIMDSDRIPPYKELIKMLEGIDVSESNINRVQNITEKNLNLLDVEKTEVILSNIKQLYEEGCIQDSEKTQKQINELYRIMSSYFSESLYVFSSLFVMFLPGTTGGDELDSVYGKGFADYLNAAARIFYYQNYNNSASDISLFTAFNNILNLYIMEDKEESSAEILSQVEIAYNIFSKVIFLSESEIRTTMHSYKVNFCYGFVEEKIAKGNKAIVRVAYKILSDAIDYYCDHIKNM